MSLSSSSTVGADEKAVVVTNHVKQDQLEHANRYIEPGADIEANLAIEDDEEQKMEKVEVPDAGKPFIHPMHPSQIPDGGRQAWLCVAGGAASLFCTFGWINVVGVFQEYYVTGPLKDYSPSTVGWIVSTEVFFMMGMMPFTGWLFDNFGPRYLLIAGTFFHVFGLMMTSLATEYYQFFLAQAVCSALGASMAFGPAMNCAATWFFKKRGLAIGLVAAGSSLGGVIFPIVFTRLLPRIGFGWTVRVCAFIILALMIFANLTVRSRIQPTRRTFSLMAFVRPFKEPAFALTVLATFISWYGIFMPISFIPSNAIQSGMSVSLAQYLVSIMNAVSIFGRTLPGFIGDKLGRYNTMIFMTGATGVLILALWIPGNNNIGNIFFASFFGFSSGAAIGLTPAMIAQISEIKDIGTRTGAAMGIGAVAALTATPIGGALVSHHNGSFVTLKVLSGVLSFVGMAIFVAARVNLGGWAPKVKV